MHAVIKAVLYLGDKVRHSSLLSHCLLTASTVMAVTLWCMWKFVNIPLPLFKSLLTVVAASKHRVQRMLPLWCSDLSTWEYQFSYAYWSQATLSSVSTWMGDSYSSVAWVLLITLKSRLDLISRVLFTVCWLCADAELASGKCRLGRCVWNLWFKEPLAPDLRKRQARLEIPIYRTLCDPSWVSRMKQKINTPQKSSLSSRLKMSVLTLLRSFQLLPVYENFPWDSFKELEGNFSMQLKSSFLLCNPLSLSLDPACRPTHLP